MDSLLKMLEYTAFGLVVLFMVVAVLGVIHSEFVGVFASVNRDV